MVGGKSTASITCTTPLSVVMSATVTIALFIRTLPPSKDTVMSSPFSVVTVPAVKSVDNTFAPTTWYNKISASAPVGSSSNSSTTEPNAAKAASVGANTVNGPAPDKSSSSSAAITAASNVLWSSELTMTSTTVLACAETANNKPRDKNVNKSFFISNGFV